MCVSHFRYDSVQSHIIDHFIKFDLDSCFVVTHAPHQSAYNIVERRMAPLSHDLAGLILPHEREAGVFACDSSEQDGHFDSLQTRILLSTILPNHNFKHLPFDFFCPSIQKTIKSRVCKTCGIYFCSASRLKSHRKY